MKIVLDTSAYSALFRGDKSLAPFLENEIVLSHIVLAELRSGFVLGTKQKENEKLLQRFLDQNNVSVVDISNQTTIEYAHIFANLRSKGTPISTNDMWIAALCLEHKLPLLTLDSDFSHIDGLRCIDLS